MSKKRFSEGLDDLFKDLPAEEETWGHASDQPLRERKAGHKNFVHDLDQLLQEAMDETASERDAELPAAAGAKSKVRPSYSAPMEGLDALIRQTIDIQELNTDEASGKKRLTVAIDKVQLERLKAIARLENSYLKDIMIQLINAYIREYSKEKGIDLS